MTGVSTFRVSNQDTYAKFRSLIRDKGVKYSHALNTSMELYIKEHGAKAKPQIKETRLIERPDMFVNHPIAPGNPKPALY